MKKAKKKTGKFWKTMLIIGVVAAFAVVGSYIWLNCVKDPEPETSAEQVSGEHVHDYVLKDEIPATCGEAGKKTYECACGLVATVDVQPLSHDYVLTEIAPTCTQEGAKNYECSNCGNTYSEAIPTTEHEYVYDVGYIAATCTQEGHQIYACICGDTVSEVIPVAHEWELTDSVAGSCVDAGTETYECSLCGEEKTEEVYGEHVDQHGDGLGIGVDYPDGICDLCGFDGNRRPR